jgi:hypothetical protein
MAHLFTLIFLTVALAAAWHTGQTQNPDCATVTVDCPDQIDSNKPIKFTAKVTGGKRYGEVTYNWGVTKGTISLGQGTATIEVDLKGEDCRGLVATVEAGGIEPKNCTRQASCAVCIR